MTVWTSSVKGNALGISFRPETSSVSACPRSLKNQVLWFSDDERMSIAIPKDDLRSFLHRPQLTPSTTCPPRLNIDSPTATKDWAWPQSAQATILLHKVVSQPSSPRSRTPAISNAQGTKFSDCYSSSKSVIKDHCSATGEKVRRQSAANSETGKSTLPPFMQVLTIPGAYFSFPNFEGFAEQRRGLKEANPEAFQGEEGVISRTATLP